jgi:hypothetical protein
MVLVANGIFCHIALQSTLTSQFIQVPCLFPYEARCIGVPLVQNNLFVLKGAFLIPIKLGVPRIEARLVIGFAGTFHRVK